MIDVRERWRELPDFEGRRRSGNNWISREFKIFLSELCDARPWVSDKDLLLKYRLGRNACKAIVKAAEARRNVTAQSAPRHLFRDWSDVTESDLLGPPEYRAEDLEGEERAILQQLTEIGTD